jgi:hypothetical protein
MKRHASEKRVRLAAAQNSSQTVSARLRFEKLVAAPRAVAGAHAVPVRPAKRVELCRVAPSPLLLEDTEASDLPSAA